jgi:hypothetical protein
MAEEIIPFRIDVPDADLADLRDRLRRTRWPDRETVDDWSQGTPLAWVHDLRQSWASGYDWRAREARLITSVVTDPAAVPIGCTAFPGEVPHLFHRVRAARPMAPSGVSQRTQWRHWVRGDCRCAGAHGANVTPGLGGPLLRTLAGAPEQLP